MLIECKVRKIDAVGLSVTEIKKHATGKGNADKQMMIESAYQRWGIVTDSSDEADSLAILSLALLQLHGNVGYGEQAQRIRGS
jgi:Holliday junction resolvasome RuvABC endonuclease subunit